MYRIRKIFSFYIFINFSMHSLCYLLHGFTLVFFGLFYKIIRVACILYDFYPTYRHVMCGVWNF